MHEDRFDTFAKVLGQTNSRRAFVKALGVGLVGALLGGRGAGQALADTGVPGTRGNSACAHFCAAVFGADTPAAGRCTSDAAHQTGLCYTCGPASPQGTQPICCPESPAGTCTSYSSATCCTGGRFCQNGTCSGVGAPCTTDPDCAAGVGCPANATSGFCFRILDRGHCVCGFST